MGQILIRKIDDGALERLHILARERGMPLETFARNAIEEIAQRRTGEEMKDWLDKLEKLRATTPVQGVDSVPLIRRMREDNDTDD